MLQISQDQTQQILSGFKIPPQPEILVQIQEECEREFPEIGEISELISRDGAMSAFILKAVNSPAFGLNRTVSDIKQSVMLLGLSQIKNLVGFYQLSHAFKGGEGASLQRFWDDSAEIARMCSLAVRFLNLSSACPSEYAYSAGLFHDCGIAAMALRYDDYKDTLRKANQLIGHYSTHLEELRYKTNHAVVGFYILTSWNMPRVICEFVARHHDPLIMSDPNTDAMQKDLFAILKLSENTLHKLRRADEHSEWSIFQGRILDHFGMSDIDYEEVEADLMEAFKDS